METPFRLRGPVVCSPYGCGFRRVFCRGLNTNRIMKRKLGRPYTEGRTRNTHAVWLVADELVDPDGLGGEGTDIASTGRVLAAPRTPTKAEREEHDVSHVPCRFWCRFCVMGSCRERRHLTQSGDRDDDRPRVLADYGYLSGDSTPLLVAQDRRTGMTFAAAVSVKGGGDPHAARLLAKWIHGWGARMSLSEQTESQASVILSVVFESSRAEGTTTVDEISPPGDSAGNGIAERAILIVGGLVRTAKAVVEENVLEGRDAGPRLTAWMVHHAAHLRLHGWSRRTHAIQTIKGAQVRHPVGRFR